MSGTQTFTFRVEVEISHTGGQMAAAQMIDPRPAAPEQEGPLMFNSLRCLTAWNRRRLTNA